MSLFQILSTLVVLVIFLAIVFRKRLEEEYHIITRRYVEIAQENAFLSYFVPLTWSERTKIQNEYLQILQEEQKKLPNTLLAKFFIDYSDVIAKGEYQLQQRLEEAGTNDDFLSFSTSNLYQINANRSFNEEELVEFGERLDSYFEDSALETLIVYLNHEGDGISITISTCGEEPNENAKARFKEFVSDLKQSLFKDKQISLQVEINSDDEQKILQFSP